ncbi:hypothetical protein Ndes2526A_g02056 [Nannochloris sp. 'desiccata']
MDQHDELELMFRREAEREAYALQEEENESESEEEEEGETVAAKGVERQSARNEASIPEEWPTPEELTHEQRIEYEDTFSRYYEAEILIRTRHIYKLLFN